MKQDSRLYNLYNPQFEELVCHICKYILGTGVFAFSTGPDGGRDGSFEGTAEQFPSNKKPYSGKFVIQAKHTTNPTAKCSDSDFTQIIKEEILRIEKL